MSPKSKGRPKGRGRTPARAQQRRQGAVRELTTVDRVVRDARFLAGSTFLDAQLGASAWLGEAWAARGMGARTPEAELVTALVGEARRGRRTAAYLALHALGTIPRPEWRDDLAAALDATPSDLPVPAWAGRHRDATPELPVRVQLWSDPWGSQKYYLLGYADPEPHVVTVAITTVGGTYVQSIEAGQQQGEPDESIGDCSLQGDVDTDEALAALADALWQTDMYWPPQREPDYVRNRALLHWRTTGRREDKDWEPLPDPERRALIQQFRAEHGPDLGLEPSIVEVLADTFIDFGEGYLVDGVLSWSPGEVERFLLDWAQRKVILEPEVVAELPKVLRVWVGYALRRRGLAEEHVAPVVEAVDEFADDYLREAGSGPGSAPRGPAAELMSRLIAEDVDLDDKDAISRVVGAYNAEQNARRLLGE